MRRLRWAVAWASLAFGLIVLLAAPAVAAGDRPTHHDDPPRAFTPVERKAQVIRQVFGRHGRDAVKVARCESGPSIDTNARNGRYYGSFQLGPAERRRYGYGRSILAQARGAKRLFDHRGWQPWSCRP